MNNQAKREGDNLSHQNKFPKFIATSSSRQLWSLKNPRIVRVSRTCGGKDRHSKVCTVKGLRDRRIRLSVPTAIQLFDLQERLGLNQPSKVIEWLINVTLNDIEKLPPLPNFPQLIHQEPSSSSQSMPDHHHFPTSSNCNQNLNEQNFFPLQSSIPHLMNWDHHHHPNLSLAQFGDQGYSSFSFSSQTDAFPNITSNINFPPFPSQIMENVNANDHQLRQINSHFQKNSIFPTTLHLKAFSLDEFNSKGVDRGNINS